MKPAIKQLLFTHLLLASINLNAGTSTVGNGGDVMDCGGRNIKVLDVYELEFFDNKTETIFDRGSISFTQKISSYLTFLDGRYPLRGKIFRENFIELTNNTEWTNEDLQDIPDSQHLIVPNGCEVKQIAIQSRLNGRKKLLINRPLFERLSESNKAALITHELIYSEAIDLGQRNSINTRLYNRTILSSHSVQFDSLQLRTGFNVELSFIGNENVFIISNEKAQTISSSYGTLGVYSNKRVEACGIYNHRQQLYIPCASRPNFLIQIAQNRLVDIEGNNLPGTIVGLPFGINSINFQTGTVKSEEFRYTYDQQEYICLKNQPLTILGWNQSQGQFSSPAQIDSCIARIDTPRFNFRYMNRMENNSPQYKVKFNYISQNNQSVPNGIRLESPTAKWDFGMTFNDRLEFQVYEENFLDQTYGIHGIFQIMNLSPTVVVKIQGELSFYAANPPESNSTPKLKTYKVLSKPRTFVEASRICLGRKYYHRDSNEECPKLQSASFSPDEQIVKGTFERDIELNFVGSRAHFASSSEVDFLPLFNSSSSTSRDREVFRGKLLTSMPGRLQTPQGMRPTVLIPQIVYERVDISLAKIVTPQNQYNVYFGSGLASVYTNLGSANRAIFQGPLTLDSNLVVTRGKLGQIAELPICNFVDSNESVSIVKRVVRSESVIELRARIQNPSDICYWIRQ
ncbi:MAG: hypothetical protein ACK5P5_06890 [Pseudobdellovibrionaceae bacterium]